jgi:hypothetical protein
MPGLYSRLFGGPSGGSYRGVTSRLRFLRVFSTPGWPRWLALLSLTLLCFFYCIFGLSQEQLWAIKRFRLGGAEYLMWIAPALVILWKVLSEPQRKFLTACVALAGIWMTISQFIVRLY